MIALTLWFYYYYLAFFLTYFKMILPHRAAIEYANMIREFVKFDAIHKANEEMMARYQEYFNNLNETCWNHGQMSLAFYEQNYDMMIIANDILIQFCEVCSSVLFIPVSRM